MDSSPLCVEQLVVHGTNPGGNTRNCTVPGSALLPSAVLATPSLPAAGSQVVQFCKEHDIGLVMVGPEAPLVAGLADALSAAGRWVAVARRLWVDWGREGTYMRLYARAGRSRRPRGGKAVQHLGFRV